MKIESCVKCGGANVAAKYEARTAGTQGGSPECLKITCTTCGFRWKIPTLEQEKMIADADLPDCAQCTQENDCDVTDTGCKGFRLKTVVPKDVQAPREDIQPKVADVPAKLNVIPDEIAEREFAIPAITYTPNGLGKKLKQHMITAAGREAYFIQNIPTLVYQGAVELLLDDIDLMLREKPAPKED